MESRVMGNCHARFGAGENLEERICSLRLHIPPKGLPIAILRDGCFGYGKQAFGSGSKIYVCSAEPPDYAAFGCIAKPKDYLSLSYEMAASAMEAKRLGLC